MTTLAQTPHFIGKWVHRGEVTACVPPRTHPIALELPLSQEEVREARETPPQPFRGSMCWTSEAHTRLDRDRLQGASWDGRNQE